MPSKTLNIAAMSLPHWHAMSNYVIHRSPSGPLDQTEWIQWIAGVYGYTNAYIDDLTHHTCYPLSQSECIINAVKCLRKAQAEKTKTIIFGDYDADGVCGTTIMVLLLKALGIPYGYYIPNRFSEGYGLNQDRIQQAYDKGYRLLISVDNGIIAYDQIEYASKLGMEVMITDHHTMGEPLDVLTIHPDLMEPCFKGLCGAGVAYEIARHFLKDERMDILAMVATIGDMMVLENENRRIVLNGLDVFNTHPWLNLSTLMDSNGPYTAKDIAFTLVPKINALGRMENTNANQWIPYLLLEDPLQIQATAIKINQVNQLRKTSVATASDGATIVLDSTIQVVLSDTLSPGLIGLVAGSLVSKTNKPVIVISTRDDVAKASGRSIEGINLHQALLPLSGLMDTFGGHAQALGFSLKKEKLNELIHQLSLLAPSINPIDMVTPVLCVAPIQIDTTLMDALNLLEPFDKTHPQPLFTLSKPTVQSVVLLKNTYPKFETGYPFEALSFKITSVEKLMHYPWIFTLNTHTFRNKTTIQARIDDVLIV